MNAIRLFTLTAVACLGMSTTGFAASDRYDSVSAYSTDWYTYRVLPGSSWRISVKGDGDTDLDFDLYAGVIRSDGRVSWIRVRSDHDRTDSCYFTGRALGSGIYRLKIRNHGRVYNRYRISTNSW